MRLRVYPNERIAVDALIRERQEQAALYREQCEYHGHFSDDSRSAGGAAEGSQAQALGAQPPGYVNKTLRPERA